MYKAKTIERLNSTELLSISFPTAHDGYLFIAYS